MKKKTAIILAILVGCLLLCCTGAGLFAKQAIDKIKATQTNNDAFITKTLNETCKDWDAKTFMLYADESFSEPENKAKMEKMFAVFKQKLGGLKTLGNPKLMGASAKTQTGDTRRNGYFNKFTVSATFEKGEGEFDITVRNFQERQTIYLIRLNSDALMSLDKEDVKADEDRLKQEAKSKK